MMNLLLQLNIKRSIILELPQIKLPPNTIIGHYITDMVRDAIGIMLYNDCWPEVPIGEMPPNLDYAQTHITVPQICDKCKKEIKFCDCEIVTFYKPELGEPHEPKMIDSRGGEKLCPKCGTKMAYYIYPCPKCGYNFD